MARKDTNQIAFAVVQQATGETSAPVETVKAKSGRKGGIKGGLSRAAALSPEQRSAIAKRAAAARWTSKK